MGNRFYNCSSGTIAAGEMPQTACSWLFHEQHPRPQSRKNRPPYSPRMSLPTLVPSDCVQQYPGTILIQENVLPMKHKYSINLIDIHELHELTYGTPLLCIAKSGSSCCGGILTPHVLAPRITRTSLSKSTFSSNF